MKKILLILIFILIGIGAGVTIYLGMNKQATPQTSTPTSTNSNTTTSPLTYLSATIDKIEGNTLTVSQKTSPDQTRTYKVKIDNNTKIYGSFTTKPAALQLTSSPIAHEIKLEDLKTGNIISLATTIDVNNNSSVKEFTASEIRLPPTINVISGNIKSVDKEGLIIEAFPPLNPANFDPAKQPSLPEKKDFTIKLAENVEIYKNNYSPSDGKASYEKIGVADLKKDMVVSVFADSEVLDKTEITALYIEVIPQPEEVKNPPVSKTESSESSPSPTIKKTPALSPTP